MFSCFGGELLQHFVLVDVLAAVAHAEEKPDFAFEPLAAMALAMLNIGVTPTPPAMSTTGVSLAMSRKKCRRAP